MTEAEKALAEERRTLEEKRREKAALETRLRQQKAEMDALAGASAEKEQLALSQVQNEKAALLALQKLAEEKQRQNRETTQAANAYRAAAAASDTAMQTAAGLHRAYLDAQAGILAGTLAEGQPCPVCGARQHPAPAAMPVCAPTREEVEQARAAAEAAAKKATEASTRSGQTGGAYAQTCARFAEQAVALFGNTEGAEEQLPGALARVEEAEAALRIRLKNVQAQVKRREALSRTLPEQERICADMTQETEAAARALAAKEAETAALHKQHAEAAAALPYPTEGEVTQAIRQAEKARQTLEEALRRAEEAKHAADREAAGCAAALEEGKRILAAGEDIDPAVEEAAKAACQARRKAMAARLERLGADLSVNRRAKDGIAREMAREKETRCVYDGVKNLSDTAGGNLSGREKIMLETYVQTAYFDRILSLANVRLLKMTAGQYELARKKAAENNVSQSGLVPEVIDHYSGTRRSVKTLSGGEAFKASLAMALGLSDELQATSGGIRLDTMFVDEGFGSLDEESLLQVLQALSDLAQGQRLVGIISHVTELKERMERQIVVTRRPAGGSTLRVVG